MNAINRHLATNFTAILGNPKQEAELPWLDDDEYYANVAAEDRPPNPRVSLEDDVPNYFAGIAMPNPVCQEDSGE
jgi:hypothetical protein